MGSSKCANMGETSPGHKTDAPKKMVAKTLNQGQGETCTIHALANAVTQSLWTRSNIEVSPEECLGGLKQLEKVEVFGGNHVEDFHEGYILLLERKQAWLQWFACGVSYWISALSLCRMNFCCVFMLYVCMLSPQIRKTQP